MAPPEIGEALGQSEAFLDFQERLSQAAKIDRPVLILGERGTGKELAAQRLHYLSPRWREPFVALNCAALPANLIESELFGHEAGAFTGAVGRRTGRFEAAHTGTLFLDEIGTIPVEVQEKILRAVEYGTFERVGSSQPTRVDVRIVAATNADLVRLAEEGRFKRDLLDRLSFEVLFLPPLRARKDDIMLLANHFAARMAHEIGREEVPEFCPDAVAALEAHPWWGNVRELKNVVERAVYRSSGSVVREVIFDPFVSPYPQEGEPIRQTAKETEEVSASIPAGASHRTFTETVKAIEISLLRNAIEKSRYNQRRAAAYLGLTYHQFRGLLRKYGKGLLKEGAPADVP